MALKFFNLASLGELDGGRVDVAFKQAMARAVQDCEDRPNEEGPRKVTLQVELTPSMDETGKCDGAHTTVCGRLHRPDPARRLSGWGGPAGTWSAPAGAAASPAA